MALLILVVGCGIAYIVSLNKTDPHAPFIISITISLTCLGVGLSVIIATSDWWFRR